MNDFVLALVLPLLASPAASLDVAYADAYKQMEQTGRPLLVLIGADWCPGCRSMKMATVPELQRAGHLDSVVMTQVNTDREPELAKQLMRGGSIPQLVLFTRNGDTWKRNQLTGAQNPQEVRAFLLREIANHQAKPGVTTRAAK